MSKIWETVHQIHLAGEMGRIGIQKNELECVKIYYNHDSDMLGFT